MDTTLRTATQSALPGSQPQTQDLLPEQACQLLQLHRHQCARLQVQRGQLWLTQEGRLEDRHLRGGEYTLLKGPGRFHLGALGPEGCRVQLLRGAR
ncbi:DUF2917 domain-containing protein [Paucibacter sp. DJ2R-2]|uniref:DUF2917 domain-containing protein n=1 Tax=Paucibacter sp. DJ2R-2 TaxID=2893558 RepID=UPI0021E42019|nr:DUF2917 domain-containing protein [Paucibacter sp. DJ2R-2]MCV2421654.1 DUF2917 domain-containing protein [Paucibacter sp. DJ4R-1]MCV2438359.1 DUF2917 domain-containing protein [Paucibacter sp. DJ2R-2]